MTAARPRTVAEIPTPALLVDVAAMERNIRRMEVPSRANEPLQFRLRRISLWLSVRPAP